MARVLALNLRTDEKETQEGGKGVKAVEHTTVTTVYQSEVMPELKTMDEELGRVIDWADRHPLFEVGLMTDERCRPLDRDRKVAIENLAAAGNLLAGNNQPWDGAGVGFAACSGIKAAGLFLEPRAKGE